MASECCGSSHCIRQEVPEPPRYAFPEKEKLMTTNRRVLTSVLSVSVLVGCNDESGRVSISDSATASAGNGSITATTDTTSGSPDPTSGAEPGGGGVSASDSHGGSDTTTSGGLTSASDGMTGASEGMTSSDPGPAHCMCKIEVDGDGLGVGNKQPPPQAFEPVVEWEWTAPDQGLGSLVTPLVANLTDDNGDGEIDLCDTPDVVVMDYQFTNPIPQSGRIHVFDGATGSLHFTINEKLYRNINPAIGDIDGDGISEIVAVGYGYGRLKDHAHLMAFEHNGNLKWESSTFITLDNLSILMADLDNDKDVEIFVQNQLYDHHGVLQWESPHYGSCFSPTAADLDGDGDLELIPRGGSVIYHHDGSIYYYTEEHSAAWPQVANLDEDPEPEILGTDHGYVLTLLEHTGALKSDFHLRGSPATIADFDGDGVSDVGFIEGLNPYKTYRADGTMIWEAPLFNGIINNIMWYGSSAFDFDSDGIFEVVTADRENIWVFGESGQVLMQIPHLSQLGQSYPIVADVDNDGSAEIVVVSSYSSPFDPKGPTVRVIGDKENRWPQARRIWNQHSYHVSNVNEDGTIPQFEQPSWKTHNTFRVNTTLKPGGVCEPTPG